MQQMRPRVWNIRVWQKIIRARLLSLFSFNFHSGPPRKSHLVPPPSRQACLPEVPQRDPFAKWLIYKGHCWVNIWFVKTRNRGTPQFLRFEFFLKFQCRTLLYISILCGTENTPYVNVSYYFKKVNFALFASFLAFFKPILVYLLQIFNFFFGFHKSFTHPDV